MHAKGRKHFWNAFGRSSKFTRFQAYFSDSHRSSTLLFLGFTPSPSLVGITFGFDLRFTRISSPQASRFETDLFIDELSASSTQHEMSEAFSHSMTMCSHEPEFHSMEPRARNPGRRSSEPEGKTINDLDMCFCALDRAVGDSRTSWQGRSALPCSHGAEITTFARQNDDDDDDDNNNNNKGSDMG